MLDNNSTYVSVNGYSLSIINSDTNSSAKKIVISGESYFAIPHRSEYRIRLSNTNGSRCDATVWIDDINVGVWRINSYDSIILERPADESRKFVFLRENSDEAYETNIRKRSNNGLIKVVFKPEQRIICYEHASPKIYYNQSATLSSYSAGATVLGDRSDQRFDSVKALDSIDEDNVTTIYARLVVDNNRENKFGYVSLNKDVRSTKVPRRIDEFHNNDSCIII